MKSIKLVAGEKYSEVLTRIPRTATYFSFWCTPKNEAVDYTLILDCDHVEWLSRVIIPKTIIPEVSAFFTKDLSGSADTIKLTIYNSKHSESQFMIAYRYI